jgi:hypothetical protein
MPPQEFAVPGISRLDISPAKKSSAQTGLAASQAARLSLRQLLPGQTAQEAARLLVHRQAGEEPASVQMKTPTHPSPPEALTPAKPRLDAVNPSAAATVVSKQRPVSFVYREEDTAPLHRELWEILRVKQETLHSHRITPGVYLRLPIAGRGVALLSPPIKPGHLVYPPLNRGLEDVHGRADEWQAAPFSSRQASIPTLIGRNAAPELRLVYKQEAAANGQADRSDDPNPAPDIEFREKTTVRTVRETREQKGETITKHIDGVAAMNGQWNEMLAEIQTPVIVKRLADQVYNVLERRLRTERLRKGLL